ncbi:Protein ASPARTIC PROTEASE IN GUARD CELL 1 [Morella rubra]|uniref:Protein ASPARTIC PROTEASE IN GUARD CELL 1 n=1 Tax=Morella rubra TaxID=262757 RepID=A0A6A1V0C9_9ROSI|nr:Protein ASPARTIC PROTEASE IN GUARD CELL 1 [Morella rubra]
MATRISSSFRGLILLSFFAYLCLCAHEAEETTETQHHHQISHTIPVISLIPSNACTSSAKGSERKASLEVIHKYGPCFQSKNYDEKVPNHLEILLQDQARVNSIHSRLSKEYSDNNKSRDSQVATLPATSGLPIGTGNYIVTVGLGTPKNDLKLIFDTGSDLTWTQCEPCARSCYSQVDPIFDPSKSTSYSKISCNSSECSQLISATGKPTTLLLYLRLRIRYKYGDGSFTIGDFSKDRLTITTEDVLDNFLFGCGQDNEGLFKGAAGLLGLGRNQISIVKQAAQKYGQFFSYCLPSTSDSKGHLTFGNGGVSSTVKFTALQTLSQSQSFYGLDLIGLSVGGTQLSIPKSAFSQEPSSIPARLSKVCLAFAGNRNETSIGIIGNTQQRELEVVYDVAGERIGFGKGGCR